MERKYACNQCEYSSHKSSNLKQHKKSKHDGVSYPCDQCEYAATAVPNLKRHKQSKQA